MSIQQICNIYYGLAADTKPTSGVDDNATFIEVDTGKMWRCVSNTWTTTNQGNTSTLGTGIIKSTTGTGAYSIAVANDFPTLNQNTTGTAGGLSSAIAQSLVTSLVSDLSGKQATLVSATNIKTINGSSVLGSGDLVVSGSGLTQAQTLAITSIGF